MVEENYVHNAVRDWKEKNPEPRAEEKGKERMKDVDFDEDHASASQALVLSNITTTPTLGIYPSLLFLFGYFLFELCFSAYHLSLASCART